MNRPLTEAEAACIHPLLERLKIVTAQQDEIQIGISSVISTILGRPTRGARLTSIDDRLTIVVPDTPDEIARQMEALVADSEGGD